MQANIYANIKPIETSFNAADELYNRPLIARPRRSRTFNLQSDNNTGLWGAISGQINVFSGYSSNPTYVAELGGQTTIVSMTPGDIPFKSLQQTSVRFIGPAITFKYTRGAESALVPMLAQVVLRDSSSNLHYVGEGETYPLVGDFSFVGLAPLGLSGAFPLMIANGWTLGNTARLGADMIVTT